MRINVLDGVMKFIIFHFELRSIESVEKKIWSWWNGFSCLFSFLSLSHSTILYLNSILFSIFHGKLISVLYLLFPQNMHRANIRKNGNINFGEKTYPTKVVKKRRRQMKNYQRAFQCVAVFFFSLSWVRLVILHAAILATTSAYFVLKGFMRDM